MGKGVIIAGGAGAAATGGHIPALLKNPRTSVTALVDPNNDVERAVREIIRYLKNDNSDHAKNTREYAVKNLDWEIIAEKYLKSLKNYTKLIG